MKNKNHDKEGKKSDKRTIKRLKKGDKKKVKNPIRRANMWGKKHQINK